MNTREHTSNNSLILIVNNVPSTGLQLKHIHTHRQEGKYDFTWSLALIPSSEINNISNPVIFRHKWQFPVNGPKVLHTINSLHTKYNTQLHVPSNNCTVFSQGTYHFAFFRLERSFKHLTLAVMNNDMDRRAEVNTGV